MNANLYLQRLSLPEETSTKAIVKLLPPNLRVVQLKVRKARVICDVELAEEIEAFETDLQRECDRFNAWRNQQHDKLRELLNQ